MNVQHNDKKGIDFLTVRLICILTIALAAVSSAYSQSGDFVPDLMERFTDVANLYPEGKEKVDALNALLTEAEAHKEANLENAEAWFMVGFVRRAAMLADDDFGLIASMRESDKLESEINKALELDEGTMHGYAQSFMGSWLSSKPFGDEELAEQYMLKGLSVDPDGLMTNFLYGAYLSAEGDKQDAIRHLEKAKAAEIRPNTPKWDQRFKNLADTILSTL